MEIIVLGLNHKTAPVEVRERLDFKTEDLERAVAQAQALPSLKENMIVSTCNRVELYAVSREPEKAVFELKTFLSQFHRLPLKEFEDNLYLQSGVPAKSNAQMVRKVTEIADQLGREVATSEEALRILGVVKR